MTPPHQKAKTFPAAGVAHGFFSRQGGVSAGGYASLNAGVGSDDDPVAVAENRARCALALAVAPNRLVTAYQIHSPDVIVVNAPWSGDPEKADAMVTTRVGLALGVLTADCMPFLFVDEGAHVIGAAHAGWRGALAGVLENTVEAMENLGARRDRIRAAVGPCLRQKNFEVGLDLLEAFTAKHAEAERFFMAGKSAEKRQLDLVGYGFWRLAESGVAPVEDAGECTLETPDRYFSYRASMRDGGRDYGRNLSAIALTE